MIQTLLGGSDVTELVQEGSVTQRFGLPLNEASVRLPADYLGIASTGIGLEIVRDGVCDFNGTVELLEAQGDGERMSVVYTGVDPSLVYNFRPARDADGDFSDPSFLEDFVTGPLVMGEVLANSVTHEGALGVELGTFAAGGVSIVGAPTNWPMTLAQLGGLFASTGRCDIIHTPISGSGNRARVDVYNGDFGADLSGSVVFRYATGATSNVQRCTFTLDSREIVNKLWDLLGPRKNQQQWWGGNITGDHPALDQPPYSSSQPAIAAAISASRATYRVRMLVQQFDQFSNRAEAKLAKALYLHRWQAEAYLRSRPKVLVELAPDPGIAPAFGPGDKIGAVAGAKFLGGFSGAKRVMEMTYRWGTEGYPELGAPIGQAGKPPPLVVSTSGENP